MVYYFMTIKLFQDEPKKYSRLTKERLSSSKAKTYRCDKAGNAPSAGCTPAATSAIVVAVAAVSRRKKDFGFDYSLSWVHISPTIIQDGDVVF
jgi:hypothetical protein